jgi:NitT/TauT family transport system substrate-binding protein
MFRPGSLAIVCPILLLAACGGSAPAATPPSVAPSAAAPPASALSVSKPVTPAVTLRVGSTGNAVEAPMYWADAKGYFKDEGITLQVSRVSSGVAQVPLLTSDKLDIGTAGPDPGMFNAVGRGLDLRVTAYFGVTSPKNSGLGVVIRKDLIDAGTFKGAKDLKSLSIATNSKVSSAVIYLDRALQQGGLSLNDVNLVEMPFPDMVAALQNKKVDGAIEVQPFIGRLEADGTARMAFTAGQTFPGTPQLMLLYGAGFIKNQPDAARRFMVAFLRAQRDQWRILEKGQGNPDDIYQVLQKAISLSSPQVFQALVKSDNLGGIDPNGGMDTHVLDEMQDFFLKAGSQQARVDSAKLVDPSFMQYAVQQLGRVS